MAARAAYYEGTGPAGEGVDPGRVGERVWLWNAAWRRPYGTAAEYVVLPEQQAVALPDGVSLETGACLGIPAFTAYHAVHCHGGVEGQQVLIAGGAGAVVDVLPALKDGDS